MEINKSHFGTMTNIIIDAAYALRSRLHLQLHHINLRFIFFQRYRCNFGNVLWLLDQFISL